MALSREQILSTRERLKREEVEIPEWDDTVFVRELLATERDQLEARFQAMSKNPNAGRDTRAWVAMKTICDKDGASILTDVDLPALLNLSAAALDRVFDKAMVLSGITDDSVEVAEKNS